MTVPLPTLEPEARRAYRAAVQHEFARMKRIATPADLLARTIPMPDGIGALQPICDLMQDDATVIRDLTAWRDMHQAVYPTRFIVSDEKTRIWLRDAVLGVEDRIMFFVLSPEGRRIGHIGVCRALNDSGVIEMSNAMRGIHGVCPGIMRMAFITIMEWARATMAPVWFDMRVFTHNTRALALYQSLGFRPVGEVPLRKHVGDGREDFLPRAPEDSAPPDATHMFLVRRSDDPDGAPPPGYRIVG